MVKPNWHYKNWSNYWTTARYCNTYRTERKKHIAIWSSTANEQYLTILLSTPLVELVLQTLRQAL